MSLDWCYVMSGVKLLQMWMKCPLFTNVILHGEFCSPLLLLSLITTFFLPPPHTLTYAHAGTHMLAHTHTHTHRSVVWKRRGRRRLGRKKSGCRGRRKRKEKKRCVLSTTCFQYVNTCNTSWFHGTPYSILHTPCSILM